MSLGLFQAITQLLPHPVLLCSAHGEILAANPAAGRVDARLCVGANLFDLEAHDVQLLRSHLNHWMRSGTPLPGALVVKDDKGALTRFRCHGARAVWWQGPLPVVQLHLARPDRTDEFVVLTQQVIALNREVAFRRAAEAEREGLLIAEQSARARLQQMYRLTSALASAATLARVAQAVQDTAPAALNAAGVVLCLHSQRLIPDLEPADGLRVLAGTAWIDLDHSPDPPDPGRVVTRSHDPATPLHGDGGSGLLQTRAPLILDGVGLGALVVLHHQEAPPEAEHLIAVAQQIAQAVRRLASTSMNIGLLSDCN